MSISLSYCSGWPGESEATIMGHRSLPLSKSFHKPQIKALKQNEINPEISRNNFVHKVNQAVYTVLSFPAEIKWYATNNKGLGQED